MIQSILHQVVARGPDDRSCFVVLIALAWYADNRTGLCWPKLPAIARQSRMTGRAVLSTIARLEEEGWIAIERRSADKKGRDSGGRGAHNRYRLNLLRLSGNEAPSPEAASPESASPEENSREAASCGKPVKTLRKSSGKAVKRPLSGEAASPEAASFPPHPHIGRTKKNGLKAKAKAGEPASPLRDGGYGKISSRKAPRRSHSHASTAPRPSFPKSPSPSDGVLPPAAPPSLHPQSWPQEAAYAKQ